ncbi:A-kinase-interacting protein 1 [Saguinus oedipus]|uniref:A-kinase-interacting protein 1 n=1 Tax=Saguinus oedipus TaxID=9490 RepID=A0ABQ9UVF0_SAGOE|nr:A-kinase-interacting protein 1 [Saguinus oedipus]
MDNCLAAAALNGLDRRSLQRSARLALEVLERAKRRAVDWRALERPRGCLGVLAREAPHLERRPAAGPQRFLPGEVRVAVRGTAPFIRTAVARWQLGASSAQKHLRKPPLSGSWKGSGQ